MDSIFSRSTSLNSAGTSFYDNNKIINAEEIIIEDFYKSIDNWEIPRINKDQIYKYSRFQIFKSDFTIKTEERDIQLTKPFETINLLSQNSLQKLSFFMAE